MAFISLSFKCKQNVHSKFKWKDEGVEMKAVVSHLNIYIYIPHMDNDSQLIQHRIISFFLLCANLMDISNKLAKHNNKYK